MDTYDLLPTLAGGNLEDTSAPEVVAAVVRSQASGTLSLEGPKGAEVRVFFRAGEMCGTAFFEGFHTLAHVLLAQDWVGAVEIDESRAVAEKEHKRHGQVLVERGLLTAERLRVALAAQHRHNLAALLELGKGHYEWRGWEPPPAWAKEVSVDAVGVLADTFATERLAPRRAAVMRWLGNLGVAHSADLADLRRRVTLSDADHQALALLEQPRRVSDLSAHARLPRPRAEALVVTLLLVGGLEPKEAVPAPLPQKNTSPPQRAKVASRPAAAADEAEAIARIEGLELDGDEDSLEEVEPEPEPDDESFPVAPDRGHQPPAGIDDESAAAVRRKMVARGLRNLAGRPAQPEAGPPLQREDPAFAAEEELPAEATAFEREVRERAARAAAQTAYELLGLSQSATTDRIRAAYLDAVKRYHPDRAGALGAPSLLPELRTLFVAIKDAYDAIATPQARQAYAAKLRGEGEQPGSRRKEARLALQMGEVLLKKRDFPAALQKLKRAIDLDANGDSLAAYAWALLADPAATSEARAEAASFVQRALRAPGATARTYYVAGIAWRAKDPDSAADAFRKALEIDPKHTEAALELRLIELRSKKGKKSGGGVLSDLLFGKRKG